MNNLIIKEYLGSRIEFKVVEGVVYANATKMMEVNPKKRINDWTSSKATKELVEAVSSVTEIPVSQLIDVKKGNSSNFEQGTWVHEDLVLDLAQWLDVKFRLWCNKQIATLIREGEVAINTPKTYKEALIALIEAEEVKEKLLLDIKEKDTKIEDLEITLDEANDWASIKRVEMITGDKYNWRDLKKESIRIEVPIKSVFDANYGSVKSYHKSAWLNLYGVNIREF